jgi:CBS domain containing-hemolysin-like protein
MTALLIPLAIIFVLVLLNGLFVAAEFAIVGAPRASVEHAAAGGNRLAQRVHAVLEDPQRQDRYIATTQIGISVASLGLGMYGEHEVATLLVGWLTPVMTDAVAAAHILATVIAVALLTCLHIVLGEMVPKALALQRAETMVLYVTPAVLAIQTVLKPLVVALNGFGNMMLALLGVHRQEGGEDRYHSSEELQFIIAESTAGGQLRGESGQLLRDLFEFGDLTAGEVMVPRVYAVGIAAGTGPAALRTVISSTPHTRYPVHTGDLDQIIGSIHVKRLLDLLVTGQPVTAADARPLPYVPASTPLTEVLTAMRRMRAQMAVVMDEHGGTAGLVTIEDLFEEVVGEIDEGRGRVLRLRRDGPGRLRVAGQLRLDELGQALGLEVQHPAARTVSGLVLAELGRPPVAGDRVTHGGLVMDVLEVSGRGVGEALVTRAAASGTGPGTGTSTDTGTGARPALRG